jgi:hypothetical protein
VRARERELPGEKSQHRVGIEVCRDERRVLGRQTVRARARIDAPAAAGVAAGVPTAAATCICCVFVLKGLFRKQVER